MGTLEPRKNHCLILEAYERLRASGRLPRGCKLVFAGAQGWMYEPILERIDSLGLREEVVLLGPADPLEYLYNGAIMMIFPSFLEGFGLPPLEAMGCGTPVITSNTSSLPEVVGDAGIMVDPHDVDGLVEAMCRVFNDSAMREEMRTKGLIRAAGFTWERTASGYIDVLTKAYIKFIKSRTYKKLIYRIKESELPRLRANHNAYHLGQLIAVRTLGHLVRCIEPHGLQIIIRRKCS